MEDLNKEILKILRIYEDYENNFCIGPFEIINIDTNSKYYLEKIVALL